jgi:hypothetical protein
MYIASIAIWNKNKFVIVIAAGIWVINLGFLIHGKHIHTLVLTDN